MNDLFLILAYIVTLFALYTIWTFIEAPFKRLISKIKKHKIGRIVIKVFVFIGNAIALIFLYFLYSG